MADNHFDLIVIGAGPAGMMAAIRAAERNKPTVIVEKNSSAGKKLLLCGNRRCNITNAENDPLLFVSNYMKNPKFMLSMLNNYSNHDVCDFFESRGVKLKTEPEQRIFPKSNKAEDILKVLLKRLDELKVEVFYETAVLDMIVEDQSAKGVKTSKGNFFGKNILIATGGKTHQKTGSTGDGYLFAEKLGHKIIPPAKALYPFEVEELGVCRDLSGLALSDAGVMFKNNSGTLFKDRGSVLFADFGLSGPLMINASLAVSKSQMSGLKISVNFFPDKNEADLDKYLLKAFQENSNKNIKNMLDMLLPASLSRVIAKLSLIPEDKKANQITTDERQRIIELLHAMEFSVSKYVHINKSVATDGGIDLKEIDNKTLESKIIKGLYFAGEILDVVGKTGGFNLQAAWSTGWTVGEAVRSKE